MFNINPEKMQAMMKKLGIKNEEIEADRVVIEKKTGKIIIENPSVTKINMQGQETFQISGDIKEEEEGISDEDNTEKDIATIMEKTGKSEKQAKEALENANGDLAEAILSLS